MKCFKQNIIIIIVIILLCIISNCNKNKKDIQSNISHNVLQKSPTSGWNILFTPRPSPTPNRFITEKQEQAYIFNKEWGIKIYKNKSVRDNFIVLNKQPGRYNSIAINKKGYIYISQLQEPFIQVYDLKGKYIKEFSSKGSFKDKIIYPSSIAADSESNIYVIYQLSRQKKHIQKFDYKGNFLLQKPVNEVVECDTIRIDKDDNIYIEDSLVNKYNKNYKLVNKFDYINYNGTQVNINGGIYLSNLNISSQKKLYIIYTDIGRTLGKGELVFAGNVIQTFDEKGDFIKEWHTDELKGIRQIGDIAIDSKDNIYLEDIFYNCIWMCDKDLNIISIIGKKGKGYGEFMCPIKMAFDKDDNLYLFDIGNSKIQKYIPNPDFRTEK